MIGRNYLRLLMLFLYQTRQGSYSVITKKQTALFNDLFYLVTGILRPLIGQLITQGVNRQNQAGEIITLHERPAVLVVAGRG